MTKVPNILDHLECMVKEARSSQDELVLKEALHICGQYFGLQQLQQAFRDHNAHAPPSWPLNLDEWEVKGMWDETKVGDGWWMLNGHGVSINVRRRK